MFAPNTACEKSGEIPTLVLDECTAENHGFTSLSPDNQIQLISDRATAREIYLMALAFFTATAKLVFAILVILVLMYPTAVQEIVSEDFDGIQYAAHASLYFLVTISGAMNTVLMMVNRIYKNFFERPDCLRCYVVLCALGICLQLGVYLLYEYDRTNDPTSVTLGDMMGILILVDMTQCAFFLLFECNIRLTLSRLSIEAEEDIFWG